MSAKAVQVLAAIKSAVEGIEILTGRVQRGRPASLTEGVSPPCCWIAMGDLTTEPGLDLGGNTRVILIDLIAVPTVDGSDYGSREDACIELASIVVSAIEESTTLKPPLLSVAPITASQAVVDNAALPGSAFAAVGVRCEWLSDYGEGL